MTFVCLLRGCSWRTLASPEADGLHCQQCARCGAMRSRQPVHP
ncbi:PSPA7_2676 family Cys-rich small protein [Pseudomonas plecoglossicida]|nr:PSPA7_2676 family Cys-rich small protein [Pseudomonas plecoglossicida]